MTTMWDVISSVSNTVSSFLGGGEDASESTPAPQSSSSGGGGFWGAVGSGVSGAIDQVGSWFSGNDEEDSGPVSVPFEPMTDDEYRLKYEQPREEQEARETKLRAIDQREAEWQALYDQGKVHPADGAEWRAQWNSAHGMP